MVPGSIPAEVFTRPGAITCTVLLRAAARTILRTISRIVLLPPACAVLWAPSRAVPGGKTSRIPRAIVHSGRLTVSGIRMAIRRRFLSPITAVYADASFHESSAFRAKSIFLLMRFIHNHPSIGLTGRKRIQLLPRRQMFSQTPPESLCASASAQPLQQTL